MKLSRTSRLGGWTLLTLIGLGLVVQCLSATRGGMPGLPLSATLIRLAPLVGALVGGLVADAKSARASEDLRARGSGDRTAHSGPVAEGNDSAATPSNPTPLHS
jgi:hypothetical protein